MMMIDHDDNADAEDNWDNFPCQCFNIYFVLLFVTFLWIKVKKTTALWNVLNTWKIYEASSGGSERRGGARHENRFMSDFSSPLSANRRLFLHKILVWIRSFYFWKESQTLLSFIAVFLKLQLTSSSSGESSCVIVMQFAFVIVDKICLRSRLDFINMKIFE